MRWSSPWPSASGPTGAEGRVGRFVASGTAAVIAVVLLLWMLWGFRWPPTAEVVLEPEESEVMREVPAEGAP